MGKINRFFLFLINTNAIGGRDDPGGALERVHGGVDGFHHVGDRV